MENKKLAISLALLIIKNKPSFSSYKSYIEYILQWIASEEERIIVNFLKNVPYEGNLSVPYSGLVTEHTIQSIELLNDLQFRELAEIICDSRSYENYVYTLEQSEQPRCQFLAQVLQQQARLGQ